MTSHRFEADRQGRACAVVTDGEPCGLTHEQPAQIAKEAGYRARRLLAALRQWNGAEPPPPGAYEPAREPAGGRAVAGPQRGPGVVASIGVLKARLAKGTSEREVAA